MTKRPTSVKVETKTITISYENIEAAIVSFLYATRTIPEFWDVLGTDIPLGMNDEGFIEFDIEIAKPVKTNLRVVDESFQNAQDNDQPRLPLEVFETIHVKD